MTIQTVQRQPTVTDQTIVSLGTGRFLSSSRRSFVSHSRLLCLLNIEHWLWRSRSKETPLKGRIDREDQCSLDCVTTVIELIVVQMCLSTALLSHTLAALNRLNKLRTKIWSVVQTCLKTLLGELKINTRVASSPSFEQLGIDSLQTMTFVELLSGKSPHWRTKQEWHVWTKCILIVIRRLIRWRTSIKTRTSCAFNFESRVLCSFEIFKWILPMIFPVLSNSSPILAKGIAGLSSWDLPAYSSQSLRIHLDRVSREIRPMSIQRWIANFASRRNGSKASCDECQCLV